MTLSLAKRFVPRRYQAHLKDFSLAFRARHYHGDRVECPCCKGHFSTFLPFGLRARANAMCPRCGALERDRLLRLYLEQRTNLFTDRLRVLHFAPEHFLQKILKRLPSLDYVSADLYNPEAMVKMDIRDIRFPDNNFDVVLCNHVLEHIPEDRKAMSELFRVLKPGGWAILQVPMDENREKTFEDPTIVTPEDRERFFDQHDHVRIYGRDYLDRLRSAGFEVKQDSFIKSIDEGALRRYAPSIEDITFCTKH